MAETNRAYKQGPIFSRIVKSDDASMPLEGQFTASDDERRKLAQFLQIESLERLSVDYRLEPLARGRYQLTGQVTADMTQLCVVTLEPLCAHIGEAIDLAFWPEMQILNFEAENIAKYEAGDDAVMIGDHLPEDPPEPIINGRIDIGDLAAEILASAIDPYPRKAGIEFEWSDPAEKAGDEQAKPFGALAKLTTKQKNS